MVFTPGSVCIIFITSASPNAMGTLRSCAGRNFSMPICGAVVFDWKADTSTSGNMRSSVSGFRWLMPLLLVRGACPSSRGLPVPPGR